MKENKIKTKKFFILFKRKPKRQTRKKGKIQSGVAYDLVTT